MASMSYFCIGPTRFQVWFTFFVIVCVMLLFSIQENEIEDLKKKNNLHDDDGPVMKKVEEVLIGMNVIRQAYHSNSFIGNHCHKVLKVIMLFSSTD